MVKHIHNFVNILAAQAVLVAIFHKAPAGIHHKQPLPLGCPCLIEHQNTGRNARAIEQVGGQADDALNIALAHQRPPNGGLGIAAKQHPVGQNHRRLARTLQRFEDVQQKGIVAVFIRRCAVLKPLEGVFRHIHPIAPRLVRKGRICHREVKGLEAAVVVFPVGVGEGVVPPDLVAGVVVHEHIHPRQGPGGVIHLLAIDGEAARGHVGYLQQQRPRAAGGVIDRFILAGLGGNAHHLGQNPRHLGGGVKLALALARLGGKVAHQVLVGIAQ